MDQGEQRLYNDPSPPSTDVEPASTKLDEAGHETPRMAHDSMVTVRLSEPPTLTLDTNVSHDAASDPLSVVDANNHFIMGANQSELSDTNASNHGSRDSTATIPSIAANQNLQAELEQIETEEGDGESSDDQEEVDWEQLEKKEDEQAKDDDTDDNSTALLLARLEQENAKLATNPKSVKVQAVESLTSSKPRPPSMAQLRQMVDGPTPPALRYSMLPPPPMTDLEFYAALVKDYQQTAARLPTLLSNKIRKGIPPPLRGVVWQSMSGARDAMLEEQYERLNGESSPYELIISKDLGRSFPGVEMFRDPEGDGQRMLGRVLKSFSLYDTKIGYCQGLAFLVGPLLMHMPDKQAFCVLVRLMERYDLRTCFLPDLAGLHVRIYQFREMLRLNIPALSVHLEELQVDPAYVSQWFLSFFATTCPLPLLFRIYDVLFAEGASETLMRVALSLMRKNEARLLASTEMEDVMQLLLSRGLWDCYHYNADEFVQDFVSLSNVVTREKLSLLEQDYKESLVATANVSRTSDISTAASRFLGRLWASSSIIAPRSTTLSPGLTAPTRPLSMLRRSTSKQSLASTLNSIEASSVSVASSTSTDTSILSRGSSNTEDDSSYRESTPVNHKTNATTKNGDDKHLHSQIEDLLTALSELQRNHALLSNQLQREREDREEDRQAVRSLLDGLRKKSCHGDEADAEATTPRAALKPRTDETMPTLEPREESVDEGQESPDVNDAPSAEDLSELLEIVENRFNSDLQNRRSSIMHSKQQLRDELSQTKDQLASAMSQSQDLSRRIHDLDQEVSTLKEQLRESHGHVRKLHQDKQKLEKQLQTMRIRASAGLSGEVNGREPDRDLTPKGGPAGLREFKLGRSRSTPSKTASFENRAPLPRGHESASIEPVATTASHSENEALLLELVQAKTAEAMAKQEAEEAKQKLEALRKATSTMMGNGQGAATAGMALNPTGEVGSRPTLSSANSASSGGGFWGWRR
ncbi:hypothetical protein S40285_07736 [Stachybotrys chlorohalonatus IBT 40285]|uniref:Rab-GAP TBC domain-containing protein n=1 Tax=Stachybotrys chlorohalonatus (strain IBT 40285) TaxID=1283841 RepID=A0A084Q8E4_STAC4|nr:hypothetical protein S40285_07736 [Stachybotrys chlorohalonata IBT 40285]